MNTDYISLLSEGLESALKSLYDLEIDKSKVIINHTKKEFKGDYTIVLFPYVKQLKKNPKEIGESVGKYLLEKVTFDTVQTVIGIMLMLLGVAISAGLI